MTRWRCRAVAVGVVISLVAACGGGSDPSTHDPAQRVEVRGPAVLEGAELRFGASAARNDAFNYQPDVVFLGGGARSIKAASSDGLVWTIDGNAPHADEVRVGKVLLATSFAAGRVLAVRDVGADKEVALGPVALTDVVRDGSFGTDEPIPLTGFSVYSTPDQPGLQTATEPDAAGPAPEESTTSAPEAQPSAASSPAAPVLLPAVELRATPALRNGPFPPPASEVPASDVGKWHVQSSCCTHAQVHVSYDSGGARVQGTASIGFRNPGIAFGIQIGGGHLVTASATLSGAAELGFGIAAAVESSAADFHGGRVQLPVDIDIPIPIAGLPLTISLRQIFAVSLGLSGRAELDTSGEYALTGNLGFSLVDGRVSVLKPRLQTTKSALDNVHSLSVAPQGLTFSYAVRLGIGIGPPGLSAGIWYQVAAALGLATSGAQLDPLQGTSLVTCKTVSLSLQGRYGVGYRIPSLVADAVNLFLGAFFPKAKKLEPEGGPAWGPSILFNKSTPPCSK